MPNYKEAAINGARWWRAKMVNIMNEYGKIPTISFAEEEVMQIAGSEEIIKLTSPENSKPLLMEQFIDASETFQLLHPETDAVIGTATYGELHVLLYSMYRHVAEKRDSLPPPTPTPVYTGPTEPLVVDGIPPPPQIPPAE